MTAQQLKNSILQLAVQGKLVPQDKHDEPASVLFEKIRAEKERLVKEGKIRKEKPLPPITEDEVPFDLPDGWVWVRLGNIVQLINGDRGKNYPSKDKLTSNSSSGLPFISAVNLTNGQIDTNTLLYLSQTQFDLLGSGKFIKGDFIFCLRGSLGKNAVAQIECGAIASSLVILRHYHVCPEAQFLKLYLDSTLLFAEIKKYDNGTAQPNLSAESLANFLFPLPPLSEQHRIVKRVEQLLPYITEYNTAEQELTALNAKFPNQLKKSILQSAVQGKLVPYHFRLNITRRGGNLPPVHVRAADCRPYIDRNVKTKIVPQDKHDEPASVLLEKIRAEKERLIKEGKIKKERPLPPIAEDEIPFDIPDSWVWVRLGNLVYNHGQITPQTDFCYIDIGSIDNKKQILSEQETIITAVKAPSRARKIVKVGDILYATVRPYLHNMCIIDREFSHIPIASTGFAVMACYQGLFNRYLFAFLLSPDFDNYVNSSENSKGVAYPAINDTRLYNALVPLPPLAEQHRIVAKCNKLITIIDSLADKNVDKKG